MSSTPDAAPRPATRALLAATTGPPAPARGHHRTARPGSRPPPDRRPRLAATTGPPAPAHGPGAGAARPAQGQVQPGGPGGRCGPASPEAGAARRGDGAG